MKVNSALTNPGTGQSSRSKPKMKSDIEAYNGGSVPAAQTVNPPTPAENVDIQLHGRDSEQKPVDG